MLSSISKEKFAKLAVLGVAVALCIYLALRIKSFAHIFQDHAGILLTQQEVAAGHLASKAPLIPRIIHQIFFNFSDPSNTTPPVEWAAARQSCIDLNDDWENMLWSAGKAKTFLEEEFPWAVSMYDGLKFPVQKIDVLRYFLLRHYGGIYIDMDNGCTANLDPLRYYPVFVVDGGRGALSNDILGAAPEHTFWIELTDSLQRYNWNYPLPYLTISYATGQWFETAIWERYHKRHPNNEDKLFRVLTDSREGAPPRIYFNHTYGGSWNNWDNELFKWIGDHVIVVIGLPIFLVVASIVIIWRRRKGRNSTNRREYVALQTYDADVDGQPR